MSRNTFINLPVKDLARTTEFFNGVGFSFNQEFTDENATCMVVADNIFVMLLVEKFFQTFTKKPIVDAQKNTEVLVCLSLDTRAEVDEMVRKALASGGAATKDAKDHGFMYEHGFQDPDGHIWELVHMVGMPE